MSRLTELDLSPTDRAALNQGRALRRMERVINAANVRLLACALVGSPRKYMQLVNEARAILNKEAKRIYDEKHPRRRT